MTHQEAIRQYPKLLSFRSCPPPTLFLPREGGGENEAVNADLARS